MNKEYKTKGWVARDQEEGLNGSNLYLGYNKPRKIGKEPFVIWGDFGDCISIPEEMFPELKYEDEPIEVELAIKRV